MIPQDTDPLRAKGTDRDRAALIHHPQFGSLWLEHAYVKDGYVIGEAWDDSGRGSALLPDDYMGQPATMNFPVGCIARWDPPVSPSYPGWSSPPGPLSRLVAWVRKWRRG